MSGRPLHGQHTPQEKPKKNSVNEIFVMFWRHLGWDDFVKYIRSKLKLLCV